MVGEWVGRSALWGSVWKGLTGDRCRRDCCSTFRPWPSLHLQYASYQCGFQSHSSHNSQSHVFPCENIFIYFSDHIVALTVAQHSNLDLVLFLDSTNANQRYSFSQEMATTLARSILANHCICPYSTLLYKSMWIKSPEQEGQCLGCNCVVKSFGQVDNTFVNLSRVWWTALRDFMVVGGCLNHCTRTPM